LKTDAAKLEALVQENLWLQAKVEELESRIAQLQLEIPKEADKDNVVATYETELQCRTEEIRRRNEEISVLTESNAALSAQLTAAKQQLGAVQMSLDNITKSYNSSTKQVIDPQTRINQLVATSHPDESRARSSQKEKEGGSGRDQKDKQLVVVRNPSDRGAVSVMLQIAAGI